MDIRLRDVPKELHLAYKLTTTMRGTSIHAQTLRLIEEYVKREGVVAYKPGEIGMVAEPPTPTAPDTEE